MVQESSLSIEETNKLRVSIGLPPIPVENTLKPAEVRPTTSPHLPQANEISVQETNELRKSLGLSLIPEEVGEQSSLLAKEFSNFEKHHAQALSAQREEGLKRRLEVARSNGNRSKLAKVNVIYDEPIDTDDWLAKLGKPSSKKSTIKTVKPDNPVTETKISHGLNELSSLKDNDILTLEDTGVLEDDEGDKLANDELKQNSKLKKDLLEKKKADSIKFNGRRYQNFEDEDEAQDSTEKSVVITGTITIPTQKEKKQNDMGKIDLNDIFSEIPTSVSSDYAAPTKIKKIKKMKKKDKLASSSRKVLQNNEVSVFEKFEDNIQDEEDELQNVLSMKRRMKQTNTRKHLTDEEIANEIKLYKRWDVTNDTEAASYVTSGLVVDDTSDFLKSLEKAKPFQESRVAEEPQKDDVDLEESEVVVNGSNEVETNELVETESISKTDSVIVPVAQEETKPRFGNLSLTLAYIQSQKIIEKTTDEQRQAERVRQKAAKEAELFKINVEIEERILREELQNDREYMNKPKVDRSAIFDQLLENRLREKGIVSTTETKSKNRRHQPNSDKITSLTGYNPQVKLKYHDDQGNSLSTKQAFKFLSHKFHGNTSRTTVEKKVGKTTEEKIV
jgi:U4/U6.U5 tri-snRNP-associated protein 1